MKKKLVILTTHFGSDFSGGSTATCEIFSRIENSFLEIEVLGSKIGKHPFSRIQFTKYHNWLQAIMILRRFNKKNVIFYGDFYNSILFVLARVNYYFTYHDNWPEQQNINFRNRIKSLFYTNIYKIIFKHAKFVIAVSNFKYQYIRQFTLEVKVVNNGFKRYPISDKNVYNSVNKNLLMVGNIDERKYKLAVSLFEQLAEQENIRIDIYGHIIDKKLAKKIQKFSFVHLKKYQRIIPYQNYKMLLHTSFSESFGMVFCEAIYHGIPIIAFDVGGAKEIVSEQNGYLVEPYDLKKMTLVIKNYLAKTMSVNSESLSLFSWEAASKSYLNILK